MYRLFLLILILPAFTLENYGQLSEGGSPRSFAIPQFKTTAQIPEIALHIPEGPETQVNTSEEPVRYGVYSDTLIDIKSSARADIISGEGKIWRLRIRSDNARSVQLVFKIFRIPPQATLFIYDDSHTVVAGAFTGKNSRNDGTFTVADFKGNHMVLEYFEPDNPLFKGTLVIGAVGQGFRDPIYSETGPGFININCPIGKDAQLDKHAVCKMSFRSGQYQVTCTGALINNTKNDGTPYFLTANHCLSSQTEAASLVTNFNYEVAGCNGIMDTSPSLSGATLLSTGQPSDYTLLLLDDIPPPTYQPFYAGWDKNDRAVDHVTGIHVPYNETKKISIDYDSIYSNPVSVTWDDDSRSPVGSHWIIGFDDGGTSQGSSGSPLFNSFGQIIGQLHGGDDEMAYYGKLSYSFGYKKPGMHTVSHYLDPDSTGVFVQEGYAPAGNMPDAFFTTRFDQVCQNAPVIFTDYSVFGPYERIWEITPATFEFVEGTSSSSDNPVIAFHQDTVYDVKLNISANELASQETLQISSGSKINVTIKSDRDSDICDCDFESLHLTADGGEQYSWSVSPGSENKIALSQNSGDSTTAFRIPVFDADSSYIIGIRLVGSQATCVDTLEAEFNVIRQVNDDIENAIELSYGMSDYYSNLCASVEDGEPIPPFISCTTQLSWCDEYGTGQNIVENSVWFKFIADSTGRVSISSTGMDNEIALYEANSFSDILNGDYTLLGANDDRSDSDFRPFIQSEAVHPGSTYWIQADGSGGGLEDDFYITITALTATSAENSVAEKLTVYPQPAGNIVFITHPDLIGTNRKHAELTVYNISGICILNRSIDQDNGHIMINTSAWDSGIYLAEIKTDSGRYIAQIVKR